MITHPGRCAVAAAVVSAFVVAGVGTAAYAGPPLSGTVIAGAGLNIHLGTPTGRVIDTMPYQSSAKIICWIAGPAVSGPYGSTTTWDQIIGYTPAGGGNISETAVAYSTDAWIYTGKDTSRLLPNCREPR